MMTPLLSGVLLGFLGSAHCVGMCGPLALALPRGEAGGWRFLAGRVAYNVGRVAMYTIIGAVMGIAGHGIAIAGFQQAASIAAGILLLGAVVLPGPAARVLARLPGSGRVERLLRDRLGRLVRATTPGGLFLLGVLNGFLPCGFVYVALAAALTMGGVTGAAALMAGFGFGTVPVMFTLSAIGGKIGPAIRARLSRVIPVLAVCLALLFILRGLNLGIPYLSPAHQSMTTEEPACCHDEGKSEGGK
jgi:sulfite exporter TauE/SafE